MSDMPKDREARVKWVIEAETSEEVRRRYDLWAAEYDADLAEVDGYQAPLEAAIAAKELIDMSKPVLDAGCGTGLSGAALADAGCGAITGVDLSEGMLAKARERGVYARVTQHDLSRMLPFPEGVFGAVVTVGTSLVLPPLSLYDFARVLKPGGHFIYCGDEKAFGERRIAEVAEHLCACGMWRALPRGGKFQPLPVSEPDLSYRAIPFEAIA